MRHLPVNWFFTVKGNLFSFIARIPTVLRGREERSKSVIENFVEIERGGGGGGGGGWGEGFSACGKQHIP